MIDAKTNAIMEAICCCNKCIKPMNKEKGTVFIITYNTTIIIINTTITTTTTTIKLLLLLLQLQ